MLIALLVAAQATGAGEVPQLPVFAQYGLIGVILTMVITGTLLAPKWSYNRERDRADRLEIENRRLNEVIIETQGKTLPALEAASLALKESQDWVGRVQMQELIQKELTSRNARQEQNREGGNNG